MIAIETNGTINLYTDEDGTKPPKCPYSNFKKNCDAKCPHFEAKRISINEAVVRLCMNTIKEVRLYERQKKEKIFSFKFIDKFLSSDAI